MGHIRLQHVSKAYKRYGNRWARLVEWLDPQDRARHEAHWVLRDVGFEVAPGESIGLIGHNGAGKSTLLKIVTGTTRPTTGTVEVGGRVAALLELGMGFHPEFTGRQNVYMAGQLLGLTADEIARHMSEIESFAEIGDYIDLPVRTYSSGMQMRLAFSVATTVRPDVLVVDEALSVGDAYFQAKCIDRIREFRTRGTTLLFVSHSPGTVKSLCDRAIMLDRGTVLRDGAPDDVLDYYNATIARQHAHAEILQAERANGTRLTRSGGREATIESVELVSNRTGLPTRAVATGEAVQLRIDFVVREDIPELTAGVLVRDALGNDVFGTNTFHHDRSLRNLPAGSRRTVAFEFPAFDLGRGNYTVSIALHARDVHALRSYDWWDHALALQVVPGNRPFALGVADLPVDIRWLDSP
jgi:lipopolysaccharide transport system ATP-binding protein